MRKFKLGDRVWVEAPRTTTERKLGTIMTIQNGGKEKRYCVEWEVDLREKKASPPGYLARELVPAHR